MKKPHTNAKPVYQYTPNGYFVKEYPSIAEAAKKLSVSRETISLVLRKVNKTARGFQFSYEKVERMEPLEYTKNRMIASVEIDRKLADQTEVKDLGIVTRQGSDYYGLREIKINKMLVYAKPNRDINEIASKYIR